MLDLVNLYNSANELGMIRRVTPSRYRAMLRQAESKQRQEIQKHNNAIRQFNNKVRQYNTAHKQAIDAYNRDVRAHNVRVRANRTRLKSELQRLANQTKTVRYTALYKSASTLTTAYKQLDIAGANPYLSDLAEQEAVNSVNVLNNLLDDTIDSQISDEDLKNTRIANELAHISPNLDSRWRGAIYALNPENPDAARHFCSSTREIISEIIDTTAPNADVFARFPNCQTTDEGTPTRRSKIHYYLDRNGRANNVLESFIDANIDNVITLFKELNSGAHGPAGIFSPQQLVSIKTRVEDAIRFMCAIVKPDLSW